MQVMISSADVSLSEFLKAGGFVRKRKCYEVKATVNDFIGHKQVCGCLAAKQATTSTT